MSELAASYDEQAGKLKPLIIEYIEHAGRLRATSKRTFITRGELYEHLRDHNRASRVSYALQQLVHEKKIRIEYDQCKSWYDEIYLV